MFSITIKVNVHLKKKNNWQEKEWAHARLVPFLWVIKQAFPIEGNKTLHLIMYQGWTKYVFQCKWASPKTPKCSATNSLQEMCHQKLECFLTSKIRGPKLTRKQLLRVKIKTKAAFQVRKKNKNSEDSLPFNYRQRTNCQKINHICEQKQIKDVTCICSLGSKAKPGRALFACSSSPVITYKTPASLQT